MGIEPNLWWQQYFDPDAGSAIRRRMAAGLVVVAVIGIGMAIGAVVGWGLVSGVGAGVFLIGVGVLLLAVLPVSFFIVYADRIRSCANRGADIRSSGETGWVVEFSGRGFRRYANVYQVLLASPVLVASAGTIAAGFTAGGDIADPRTSLIGWIGVAGVLAGTIWIGTEFGKRDLVLSVGAYGIGLVAVDRDGQAITEATVAWTAVRDVRGGYADNGVHTRCPAVTVTVAPDPAIARVIREIGYGARFDRWTGELVLDPRVLASDPNVVLMVLKRFWGRSRSAGTVSEAEASQMLEVPSMLVQRTLHPIVRE